MRGGVRNVDGGTLAGQYYLVSPDAGDRLTLLVREGVARSDRRKVAGIARHDGQAVGQRRRHDHAVDDPTAPVRQQRAELSGNRLIHREQTASVVTPDRLQPGSQMRGLLVVAPAAHARNASIQLCLLYTSPSPRD